MCEHICEPDESKHTGYGCKCFSNFQLNSDRRTCFDIDECNSTHLNNCSFGNQECINSLGGYECHCKQGYYFVNGKCEDIDECQRDNNTCDKNANCINTFGSYVCQCIEDFEGDGHYCERIIPEIMENYFCGHFFNICGKNSFCEEGETGPICICKPDHFGNPFENCIFINPNDTLRFKQTINLPIRYKGQLLYTFSEKYQKFLREVKHFFEGIFLERIPGYVNDSLLILNLR